MPAQRFTLIENGYDEDSFAAAELSVERSPLTPGCFTLLHSGIVYPSERDPRPLFAALGRMRNDGRLAAAKLRVRFRASVHHELLQGLAEETGTTDFVEILPPVPYRDALQEMLRADGLLVMQAANCNEQVPAKLYEYFRARRPILGLADPAGDTARVLIDAGNVHVAALEDTQRVEAALTGYLAAAAMTTSAPALSPQVAAMSRRARAQALAAVFAEASLVGTRATSAAKLPC